MSGTTPRTFAPARICCVAVIAALAGLAEAAASSAEQAALEHARIVRERAEVETTYQRQRAQCEEGFVVTPCLEAARKAQRDGLARLRRQEVLLDEEQRKQRAAQRMQAIRDNAQAQQQRPNAGRGQDEPAARTGASGGEPRTPQPATRSSAGLDERRENAAERARAAEQQRSQERTNVEQYEARQREAEARRRTVEQRNAKRAAEGKKPMPLPLPPLPAASSASR